MEKSTQTQPMFFPLALLFFGALIAFRILGIFWNWADLSKRFRMTRLSGIGWAWAIAAAVRNIGLYLFVYAAGNPTLQWLADLVPDPAVLNRIFGDGTSFVGFPLSGNVWMLGVYFTWIFLIAHASINGLAMIRIILGIIS